MRCRGTRYCLMWSALVGVLAACLAVVMPAGTAPAYDVRHTSIVTDNPVDWTPNVVDEPGAVRTIVQTGNTMIAGGNFTKVQNAGSSPTLSRPRLFAFN